MRCPKCKSIEDRVIDSRPVNHCLGIRRRRVCLNCEYRFTTYEEIERADLLVIKRDGRHEPFDQAEIEFRVSQSLRKTTGRIQRCLTVRPMKLSRNSKLTYGREVHSREIGAKGDGEAAFDIDEVAYVRYASVYRHFQEIGEFIDEIKLLEQRPKKDGYAAGTVLKRSV